MVIVEESNIKDYEVNYEEGRVKVYVGEEHKVTIGATLYADGSAEQYVLIPIEQFLSMADSIKK